MSIDPDRDWQMAVALKAVWNNAGERNVAAALFGPYGPMASQWQPIGGDCAIIDVEIANPAAE